MILTETRTVYRAEGARRRRFTKKAAYRDAAAIAWRKKYPCECERADFTIDGVGTPAYVCEWHDEGEARNHRARVITRLVRLWMHRDRKAVCK